MPAAEIESFVILERILREWFEVVDGDGGGQGKPMTIELEAIGTFAAYLMKRQANPSCPRAFAKLPPRPRNT